MHDKCEERVNDHRSPESLRLVNPSKKNRYNNCKDFKKKLR